MLPTTHLTQAKIVGRFRGGFQDILGRLLARFEDVFKNVCVTLFRMFLGGFQDSLGRMNLTLPTKTYNDHLCHLPYSVTNSSQEDFWP